MHCAWLAASTINLEVSIATAASPTTTSMSSSDKVSVFDSHLPLLVLTTGASAKFGRSRAVGISFSPIRYRDFRLFGPGKDFMFGVRVSMSRGQAKFLNHKWRFLFMVSLFAPRLPLMYIKKTLRSAFLVLLPVFRPKRGLGGWSHLGMSCSTR